MRLKIIKNWKFLHWLGYIFVIAWSSASLLTATLVFGFLWKISMPHQYSLIEIPPSMRVEILDRSSRNNSSALILQKHSVFFLHKGSIQIPRISVVKFRATVFWVFCTCADFVSWSVAFSVFPNNSFCCYNIGWILNSNHQIYSFSIAINLYLTRYYYNSIIII